ATSTTGGLSSRQFACAISSAPIPTPRSVISSNTPPLFSKCPDTATGVSAAEKLVAFSASSASRCTTSFTPCPPTADPRCTFQPPPLVPHNPHPPRAQHIPHPPRPSPPPRHLMPRQHQQVLAVAPHPRRQVVHLEQIRQPLGILLALLQVINQPDLPLHQRL